MNLFFEKVMEALLPGYPLRRKAYKRLIKNRHSYLYSTGWMQSLEKQKLMDGNGSPIPWMNFPVVKFLEEKLTRDLNLFEYGSGYSTCFYADKVKSVVSVEHDEKWLKVIQSEVPGNVQFIFREKDIDGDYCRAIGSTGDRYDVVIVDGRDRRNCLKQSITALSPGGVILLDDTQREGFQELIDFAIQNGFKTLNMEGLKALSTEIERTTILYREGNCLGI